MKSLPKGFKGFVWYVLPLLCYCGVLFYISSIPKPPMPDLGFDLGDKVTHAGAFFIMGILAYHAATWIFPNKPLRTLLLISVGFTSLYGATDELHQYFVPERSADIFDWVADTVGTLCAAGMIYLLTMRMQGSKRVKVESLK